MTTERCGARELVHTRFQRMARTLPDHPAVTDPRRSLTYGEVEAEANALAQRLRRLGVGRGSRVGLCHERSAVNVVGALATLKLGAAYVGMDPDQPPARLEYIVRDAAVAVMLTDRSTIGRLDRTTLPTVDLDSVVLPSGGTVPEPATDPVSDHDAAYVVYTSGSTGRPKGVEVSHRNLCSLVDWHCATFAIDGDDRASVLANPAFDAAVWELWPYLTAGAGLQVPEAEIAWVPERLRDWLVATRITIAFVPTPLAEALLELRWPADSTLRVMLTGGDALHRRPGPDTPFALVNNYGVAECTVVSTSGLVAPAPDAAGAPSIGHAITGTRLHVLDSAGAPVAAGEIGELHIAGAGVAMGYVNRPDLTAERFVADPFDPSVGARMYRTGDLVRSSPESALEVPEFEFLGRIDTQVQVRGQRVELDEIAAVLVSHPTVAQAAVIADGEAPEHVRLIAYVVASSGTPTREDALREHLTRWLPGFMIPSVIVEIAELPVTPNGKIDRDRLARPSPAVHSDDRGRTAVEVAVASIVAELLELNAIGRDDNLFDVGGHSLMAAQLVVRLEDRFDVELSLLTVFDSPTAAGIARAIEHELDVGAHAVPGP